MSTVLRKGVLCALVLGAVAAAPASAQTADPATPVVVGERAFTVGELQAAAGRAVLAPDRGGPAGAAALITAEWTAREAAMRGIVVPDAAVDAAVAEERRQAGDDYDTQLQRQATTPEQRRADLAAGIRQELVADAIAREAGAGPAAFGRAFAAAAARERAVTTCLPGYADLRHDRCANLPALAAPCVAMGLEDVCSAPDGRRRRWYVSADLITAFADPPKLPDAAVVPDGERALSRLRGYLRAHAPAVARRCDVELDDLAYYDCPSRADAVTIAYAIARVHQAAKAFWTVPATAGVLS